MKAGNSLYITEVSLNFKLIILLHQIKIRNLYKLRYKNVIFFRFLQLNK